MQTTISNQTTAYLINQLANQQKSTQPTTAHKARIIEMAMAVFNRPKGRSGGTGLVKLTLEQFFQPGTAVGDRNIKIAELLTNPTLPVTKIADEVSTSSTTVYRVKETLEMISDAYLKGLELPKYPALTTSEKAKIKKAQQQSAKVLN
jgi:hypothetical protein